MPLSEYIESRNGGYYVAGSRIGLDVLCHAFVRGRTAEDIFRAYPSMGSLAKVYGVITFVLEHPDQIAAYLKEEDRHFANFCADHPLPAEMLAPFARKSA